MHSKKLKYIMAYLIPVLIVFSIFSENVLSYSSVVVLFIFVPFIELFTKGSIENFSEIEEEIAKKDPVFDYLIYGLVPLQYIILVCFLYKINQNDLPLYVKIGVTTAYGMACGILGINLAHELGHRLTKHERFMSKMLLLTSLYMHFYIEHNRGHHKNVSTDNDPASGKLGESIYTFYFRSIWGSWVSAWKLEKHKLTKNNQPFWSWHNEMLRFQFLQLLLIAIVFYLFGLQTLLFFLAGAFMGILLLETVNYIEHYGLRRNKKENGFEKTQPIHSWNSNHPLGRMLLFELSRHSDHHYMASRKYQVLRHFDESPQLPTGYPGMMLLSLIPPLWFKIMNNKIHLYKTTLAGKALA
jgi:alkane 1-monooxygenase